MSDPAESTEASNPFFTESDLPYGMPRFNLIKDEHYVPAFELGMAEEMSEVDAIASNTEPASFDNTIVALELTGQMLDRTQRVFGAMTGAHTNDNLKEIQSLMAPQFSAHADNILRKGHGASIRPEKTSAPSSVATRPSQSLHPRSR